MTKLIQGILDFRRKSLPDYKDTFARLALGQSPDALFVTCSDSRVAVNVFASTDPGDLFVIRNVGNMIPTCCGETGVSVTDKSEAAAIEFALANLKVSSIIVCGHSECGAMQALIAGRESVPMPNLREWLRNGKESREALNSNPKFAEGLAPHNRLSQLNVLKQLDHLKTYPLVREHLEAGDLSLYGWWFELKTATVYSYEEETDRFVPIDEPVAARIIERLELVRSHTRR